MKNLWIKSSTNFCPQDKVLDCYFSITPDPGFSQGYNSVKSALFTGFQNFSPSEKPIHQYLKDFTWYFTGFPRFPILKCFQHLYFRFFSLVFLETKRFLLYLKTLTRSFSLHYRISVSLFWPLWSLAATTWVPMSNCCISQLFYNLLPDNLFIYLN